MMLLEMIRENKDSILKYTPMVLLAIALVSYRLTMNVSYFMISLIIALELFLYYVYIFDGKLWEEIELLHELLDTADEIIDKDVEEIDEEVNNVVASEKDRIPK